MHEGGGREHEQQDVELSHVAGHEHVPVSTTENLKILLETQGGARKMLAAILLLSHRGGRGVYTYCADALKLNGYPAMSSHSIKEQLFAVAGIEPRGVHYNTKLLLWLLGQDVPRKIDSAENAAILKKIRMLSANEGGLTDSEMEDAYSVMERRTEKKLAGTQKSKRPTY